ncbi:uncharacterized protein [Mytilus edulis]|uniref:uncharacterized protein n=1 Tax=Mytilus edulis TaxID=6550 RepID=UPI0039EF4CE3
MGYTFIYISSYAIVLFVSCISIMPFQKQCCFEKHKEHGTEILRNFKHVPAVALQAVQQYGCYDRRRLICTGCVNFLSGPDLKRKKEHADDIQIPPSKIAKYTMVNNDSTSASVPMNNRLSRVVQTDTVYHVDVDVQTCATVLARGEFGCQVDSVSPIFQELSAQIQNLHCIISEKDMVINSLRKEIEGLCSIETEKDRIKVIEQIFLKEKETLKGCDYSKDANGLSRLSPNDILEKQTPIVRKVINCLTKSVLDVDTHGNSKKRQFRKSLAIELLFSAKHLRYISPMSLAPLILLYNSTGSKTAVDIFSHTLPSGGYTFLQNWLLTLKPNPCVPMNEISDLVYAFDNNQRLQKVWLSRNANKQTLEVMTNIIKLELNGFNCQKNEVLDPRHWRKFRTF